MRATPLNRFINTIYTPVGTILERRLFARSVRLSLGGTRLIAARLSLSVYLGVSKRRR
jgi:hypothetical protein